MKIPENFQRNLIKELQSKETHLKISELINKDLSNSYVRVEVICDREGFWLKPHWILRKNLCHVYYSLTNIMKVRNLVQIFMIVI